MFNDIEKILSMMHDMQEMVSPDDELTKIINDLKNVSTELDEDELDLIAAAGNPNFNKMNDEKDER